MGTDGDEVIEGVGEPAEQKTLAEPPSDDLDREGLGSGANGDALDQNKQDDTST